MKNVEIDRKEVLRYLGHRNQVIDEKLGELVDECIGELKGIAATKYICRTLSITGRENSISLEDGLFELPGKAISGHLSGSGECILMAATLGSEVDKKIRYYEKKNLTKALILDACATAFIEAVCDRICGDIEEDLRSGKHLTFRFSPGYEDLPIDIQKGFLEVLNAGKRIGLTASSTNILLPRKSVTAVIGVTDKDCAGNKRGCSACSRSSECTYKRTED